MTQPTVSSADSCAVLGCSPGIPSPDKTEATRILESRRFGRLEVASDKVVTFPAGLIGFEEIHDYVLVQPDGLEPLSFLVACDNPEVAFPVLPGELCLAGYAPDIPSTALESIAAGPAAHFEILAICATAPDTGTLHANLRGPVVVNPATQARLSGGSA